MYHFIADMMMPWYFNFYLSWYYFEGGVRITYEEINADIHSVIHRILDYCEIDFDEQDVNNAVSQAQHSNTRKNKGITGRGRDLPPSVIEKIVKMSRYYENVDFKPIGIDSACFSHKT